MNFACNSTTFRQGGVWETQAGKPADGTKRRVENQEFVFYEGYWIRYYEPPEDTLEARKRLIESLTRRTFHHTEPGINTPGKALDTARLHYERETDPRKKRVNAAMLAGALFNRATDIFNAIVDLNAKGVTIDRSNELMRQCGHCFKEALDLGKQVKHYSGQEGIDELWGEPFRAFTAPIQQFYRSRYIKVAQAMRNIDCIADHIKCAFAPSPAFAELDWYVDHFATAAKYECETMRSDATNNFVIWPQFVSAGELMEEFRSNSRNDAITPGYLLEHGEALIIEGKKLIEWVAMARVPMPVSTHTYLEKCDSFRVALQRIPKAAQSRF
jgi:hypothetical protein